MQIKDNTPKYEMVMAKLKQDLADNDYSQGSYLPTEVSLADRYRVNRFAIRKALKQLEQEGFVSASVAKRRRLMAPAVARCKAMAPFIGCIGYGLVGSHQYANTVHQQLFDQLIRAFQAKNLGVVPIFFDAQSQQFPELAHSEMMSGLLSLGACHLPPLNQWTKPLIGIDNGYVPFVENTISPDGQAAVLGAVRYLAERGHRQVALVHMETPNYPFFDNVALGYARSLKTCGLNCPPNVISLAHAIYINDELLERRLRKALKNRPRPTALILCTATIGERIIDCLARIGASVPDQLSVMAIGGDDTVADRLSLTCHANDYQSLATCVRDHVINLLEGRSQTIGHVFVNSFRLVERSSVSVCRGT